MLLIARNIAGEFGRPIARVGFGRAGVEAFGIGMHVPEAAVDEDDFLALAKDEVGLTGEVAAMQAVAVA